MKAEKAAERRRRPGLIWASAAPPVVLERIRGGASDGLVVLGHDLLDPA